MAWYVRNLDRLRKILWADALLGGSTAVAGLCIPGWVGGILGLQPSLITAISTITLAYAMGASLLAAARQVSAAATRILIIANACWAVISVLLLIVHAGPATKLGVLFLVLQVIVVGGLAWLEAMQLGRNTHLAETGRQPTE